MTGDTKATVPMAITMGDASGVGPEIVLRRAAEGAFCDDAVVVYGDAAILRHGAELLGVDVEIAAIDDPGQWIPGRALQVVDLALLRAVDHRPGQIDAASGAAARQYVVAATNDALAGRVAGIVTMPMNKEATQLSDPAFVGHTELIAAACGVQRFTMMLTAGDLAVTHVSTHVSLREAIRRVTTARVTEVIELTDETLHRFLAQPRIAVCGVNPHAGDTVCSDPRTPNRSCPPLKQRGLQGSMQPVPIRPTRSSTRPFIASGSMPSSACITTKATHR